MVAILHSSHKYLLSTYYEKDCSKEDKIEEDNHGSCTHGNNLVGNKPSKFKYAFLIRGSFAV